MYSISLENNIYSSDLLLDHIKGLEGIAPFINKGNNIEDFRADIITRDFSLHHRKVLYDRLYSQYKNCGLGTPDVMSSILDEKTYTVITGHQLCLFGGPQLFIHKIVTTIKMTIELKDHYPDYIFIPVLWMASEDHDFDEISIVELFGKNISVKGNNKGPVGRLSTKDFQLGLKELKILFANDNRGDSIINLFETAFEKDNWADVTRYWVHQLFKEYGLVIVDGDDPKLKKLFSPLIRKEINEKFSVKEVLNTNDQLKKSGYSLQVNPRPVNLFYFNEGSRDRIIPEGEVFMIGDRSFTKEELLEQIENYPENFSPNVILRPLYQETILPNIAYVGGPSEVNYWLQLKGMFDSVNVRFPKIVLRNSFGWIKKDDLDWWQEQNLSVADIFVRYDELVQQHIKDKNELSFKKEFDLIKQLNELLISKISNVDPSLETMLKSEIKSIEKSIYKTEKKIVKAIKEKENNYFRRIKKIQCSVIKDNNLIERRESFISLYVNYKGDYIKELIDNSTPFLPSMKVLVY